VLTAGMMRLPLAAFRFSASRICNPSSIRDVGVRDSAAALSLAD
jgi:hypothetical protein